MITGLSEILLAEYARLTLAALKKVPKDKVFNYSILFPSVPFSLK